MTGKQFLAKQWEMTLKAKNFFKSFYPGPFPQKCVYAFYAEIQDDSQKWQESKFWQTVTDDSVYTLRAKNFVTV